MTKLDKLLTSSSNPRELSLTVKSLLISLIPLAMVVTGLPEAALQPVIDAIVDIVYHATLLVAAIGSAFGLLRKLYYKRWSALD